MRGQLICGWEFANVAVELQLHLTSCWHFLWLLSIQAQWNGIKYLRTKREWEGRDKVWLHLYGVLHTIHAIFHIHIHIHIPRMPYVNICMQCSVFFPIPIPIRVKSWHFITLCLFVRVLLNSILLWFNCIGRNCVNCHKVNQFGNLLYCFSLPYFFYDFFAALWGYLFIYVSTVLVVVLLLVLFTILCIVLLPQCAAKHCVNIL